MADKLSFDFDVARFGDSGTIIDSTGAVAFEGNIDRLEITGTVAGHRVVVQLHVPRGRAIDDAVKSEAFKLIVTQWRLMRGVYGK